MNSARRIALSLIEGCEGKSCHEWLRAMQQGEDQLCSVDRSCKVELSWLVAHGTRRFGMCVAHAALKAMPSLKHAVTLGEAVQGLQGVLAMKVTQAAGPQAQALVNAMLEARMGPKLDWFGPTLLLLLLLLLLLCGAAAMALLCCCCCCFAAAELLLLLLLCSCCCWASAVLYSLPCAALLAAGLCCALFGLASLCSARLCVLCFAVFCSALLALGWLCCVRAACWVSALLCLAAGADLDAEGRQLRGEAGDAGRSSSDARERGRSESRDGD
jgi:TM2 domain-containing membrane protein YozV